MCAHDFVPCSWHHGRQTVRVTAWACVLCGLEVAWPGTFLPPPEFDSGPESGSETLPVGVEQVSEF